MVIFVGAVVVSVPPQTVDVASATVRPVGSVSVNATPASGSAFAAGLVIVNVSELVAFSEIVEGLKALAMDGGASTFTLAEAVPPAPALIEVTLPVVLFCTPPAIPVTFTAKLHVLFAVRDAPDRLIAFRALRGGDCSAAARTSEPVRVEITRPARQRVDKTNAGQRKRRIVVLKSEAQASRAIQRNTRRAKCLANRRRHGINNGDNAACLAVAPFVSVTVNSTVVLPCGYGPAGDCVMVSASPSGSEEPLSMLAFALPPATAEATVTSCTKAIGTWLTLQFSSTPEASGCSWCRRPCPGHQPQQWCTGYLPWW